MQYQRHDVLTFRSTLSLTTGAIAIVLVVLLLGDAMIRGAWALVGSAGPWFALVAYAAFVVLMWPCLQVTKDAARVVNPWRSFAIPLTAIDDVRMMAGVTIELKDGRRVRVWGADVSRKGAASGSGQAGLMRRALLDDVDPAPAGGAPQVAVRWNWPALVALGVLLAWCALSLAL